MKKPKTIAIIPAHLESSRLPSKALLDICGLPMIVHVFKRCLLSKCIEEVYVATDSKKIEDVVNAFEGKVIRTANNHETGTDRIAEAAEHLDAEIVVNVQGDEALVNPKHIDLVVAALYNNPDINVAILVNPFLKRNSPSDIKTVLDENDDIMYFSRADIPSDARNSEPPLLKAYHVIPFRRDFLIKYARWDKGALEQIEFNEYLRILEKGYKIRAVRVESNAVSVDTDEDLRIVRKAMLLDPFYKEYSI